MTLDKLTILFSKNCISVWPDKNKAYVVNIIQEGQNLLVVVNDDRGKK